MKIHGKHHKRNHYLLGGSQSEKFVEVTTPGGNTHKIDIEGIDTIWDLKYRLSQIDNLPQFGQIIVDIEKEEPELDTDTLTTGDKYVVILDNTKYTASIYDIEITINDVDDFNEDYTDISEGKKQILINEMIREGYWDNCLVGDFIYNSDEGEYRCEGYYMVYENIDRDGVRIKTIGYLKGRLTGSINGKRITLGPNFPVGYWASTDIYCHHGKFLEPVDPNFIRRLTTIDKNSLTEVDLDINYLGENLDDDFFEFEQLPEIDSNDKIKITQIEKEWGKIMFPGEIDKVVKYLEKMLDVPDINPFNGYVLKNSGPGVVGELYIPLR